MLLHLKTRQQLNIAPGYCPRRFPGAPGFVAGRKLAPLIFKPVMRPLLIPHARALDGLRRSGFELTLASNIKLRRRIRDSREVQ